jgi:hypothetical protein
MISMLNRIDDSFGDVTILRLHCTSKSLMPCDCANSFIYDWKMWFSSHHLRALSVYSLRSNPAFSRRHRFTYFLMILDYSPLSGVCYSADNKWGPLNIGLLTTVRPRATAYCTVQHLSWLLVSNSTSQLPAVRHYCRLSTVNVYLIRTDNKIGPQCPPCSGFR